MVLVSPGVQVTVTDESQFLPAPSNSIPFILLATAQNKANPTGAGVAQATTAANAGRVFRVTSQRDLVTLYGNPFFYSTSNGTPLQGYELNEYGLLAAYSALGVTNTVYCLRADIDLAALVGSTGRPNGAPAADSKWLDTTTSTWGIHEFNSTTGRFVLRTPIVITDETQVVSGLPRQSLGSIGDYAVIAIPTYSVPTANSAGMFFYKNSSNNWVRLGSQAWQQSWPTVVGSQSNPTIPASQTLVIGVGASSTVEFQIETVMGWTINEVANAINSLNVTGLSASSLTGRLEIFSFDTVRDFNDQTPFRITISGSPSLLSALGIQQGSYTVPELFYGTSSQQPLWQAGQLLPRPNGSVWIKVGVEQTGLNPIISRYDTTAATWIPQTVNLGTSDWNIISQLDSTGGANIPAGTIYAQYGFNQTRANNINTGFNRGPIYYWRKAATGPTTVVGENNNPVFNSTTLGVPGPYQLRVSVSRPGTADPTFFGDGIINIPNGAGADEFVTAWASANIPFTTATISSTGSIVLTHTAGGVIILDDVIPGGTSNGVIEQIGLSSLTTFGVKEGPSLANFFTVSPSTSSGPGTDLQLSIPANYGRYFRPTIVNGGTGFTVGDTVTFNGNLLGGQTGVNDLVLRVTSVNAGAVTGLVFISGNAAMNYSTLLSNWVEFEMVANEGAPVAKPTNGTQWFYSTVDQVDILVNTQNGWRGYRQQAYDNNGFPIPTGVNNTDINGPIISASEPATQSTGSALVPGDLWIDTSDLENYPLINRWQIVDGIGTWVRLDNSDQTSSSGVAFADVRWAGSGTVSPTDDPIPSIQSLLTSNYIDLDAPSSNLFPVGMLVFNTRRSGYNVKEFRSNYFNGRDFPDAVIPQQRDTWVSVSGLKSDGSPFMGRKAQRAMVVKAMAEAIDTNVAIRDEDNFFNMIAAPGYPELQPNMITLNSDRGETAFIIGDTPMRLPDDATAIQEWATNANGASSTGEDGLVTRNTYLGLFYPSGITRNLDGTEVVVPASHMMIRTMLRNDSIAYPWLAPAGTRRGIIDNATSIGYIDAQTGEFQSIRTRLGIRDVLYTNNINPLVFFTGNGLLNYGNKSSFASSSALDRINVARLVAFVRRQLTLAARPFIFEPNDSLTRQQISGVVETLLIELVATRGVYDYLVVCDESNNTPARIDRNELWVDVAIEPVKAVEFIYVPVRIFNTGELGGRT